MSVQYPYLPTLADAATILNIACAPDTDPAAVAADVMRVRSLLASVEYTIAEARPALTVAEVRRDYGNDPETLESVRAWRDRYDFADVSELPAEDDGDPAWEIVAGGTLADVGREDYDVSDEDDAASAAEAANLRDYEESAYGWPFAHNYAAKIDEREADRFASAGFVVARYRGGELYAGIDGGGYDFTEAHWLPVFLAAQVAYNGKGYVRTSGGVRVVVA